MRKIISLFLVLIIIAGALCGCSGSKDEYDFDTYDVEVTETTTKKGEVDIDLTTLSATVVYSEVYNMIMTPDNYRGKTVKMKGAMATAEDEETGEPHYACVIADATACCQQGIEFRLETPIEADEYPADNTEIEVVGTFDTYNIGDIIICYLNNATMKEA